MPSQSRRSDQKVDAFSAPLSLLEKANKEALSRRMTKSGFYRYCLAKECGYSHEEAMALAEHRGLINSLDQARLNESSGNYGKKKT